MRLLCASTITLEEFPEDDVPDYAILSHTWGADEVTYQDYRNPSPKIRLSAGYRKLENCCAQAVADGFEYVWIDTCCIDKTSSAELSEAINSMYRWYREAKVCYAYLSDVTVAVHPPSLAKCVDFDKSRWFSRGWTLQELLAPSCVVFYDLNWVEIGTKSSLRVILQKVTGIDGSALLGREIEESVATIMSWSSKRRTTRTEDMAYSLMGLFNVKMPIIYGEGENAFMRLQQEIMQISSDQSIFAWRGDGKESGLLASSPAQFRDSGSVCVAPHHIPRSPYNMTHLGLRLQLSLIPRTGKETVKGSFYGVIDCCLQNVLGYLTIILRQVSDDQYVRIESDKVLVQPYRPSDDKHVRFIYVKQHKSTSTTWPRFRFILKTEPDQGNSYRCVETTASFTHSWQDHGNMRVLQRSISDKYRSAAIRFRSDLGKEFAVIFGWWEQAVWVDLIEVDAFTDLKGALGCYDRYDGSKRGVVLKTFDQATLPLAPTLIASASLRRGCVSGISGYIVHVKVQAGGPSPAFNLAPEPTRILMKYKFKVAYDDLLEPKGYSPPVHPSECWSHDFKLGHEELVVPFEEKAKFGVVLFDLHWPFVRVAIILGVRKSGVYTDAIVVRDSQLSIKGIADLYQRSWDQITTRQDKTEASVDLGGTKRFLKVKLTRTLGDLAYYAEVTLNREGNTSDKNPSDLAGGFSPAAPRLLTRSLLPSLVKGKSGVN